MFQTNVVEKIKIHILCSVTFLKKSCHLRDNVEKYSTARKTTGYNITRCMRVAPSMFRYAYTACLVLYKASAADERIGKS